jgi:hypothetical protein
MPDHCVMSIDKTDKIFLIHFASEELITIDENSFSNSEIGQGSATESYMAEVSVVLAKSTEFGITEGRCNNYMFSNDIARGAAIITCLVMTPRGTLQKLHV